VPPIPISQTSPVIQATNTVVVAVTNTQASGSPAPTTSAVTNGSNASSTGSDGKTSSDDKASSDDKKSASKDDSSTKDTREDSKNEPAPKKTYCN
jgi:hypothetical protein